MTPQFAETPTYGFMPVTFAEVRVWHPRSPWQARTRTSVTRWRGSRRPTEKPVVPRHSDQTAGKLASRRGRSGVQREAPVGTANQGHKLVDGVLAGSERARPEVR